VKRNPLGTSPEAEEALSLIREGFFASGSDPFWQKKPFRSFGRASSLPGRTHFGRRSPFVNSGGLLRFRVGPILAEEADRRKKKQTA
jgi:hypothetical protein